MDPTLEKFEEQLLDRLLRYVRIETTSDRHSEIVPSTQGQWDLIRMLEQELEAVGVSDITVTEHGHMIARLPASPGLEDRPVVGFMAHVDTSADVSAANVNPQVHRDYAGGTIQLDAELSLSPVRFPELSRHPGDTIITTDGTTLLGADDKAGVAEIVTALSWLVDNPDWKHGGIEAIFTTDEETGLGMGCFPVDSLQARCCYTLDGDDEATVEAECFNASKATVGFHGISMHTGTARGKLVNAVSMAGSFLGMLPRSESPESTDGRYGFYYPLEVSGHAEEATLAVYIRDFETEEADRRLEVLSRIAEAVEGTYPGGRVTVETTKQYTNMRLFLQEDPLVVDLLLKAVRAAGMDPIEKIIRGGTDGARLSELGVPTPNIFTGGHNYHSRLEWASLTTMSRATCTILHLAKLWGQVDR